MAIIDRTIIQEQQNILIYGHLTDFNNKVDYFDYHVIKNLTDNLSIIFIDNVEINISIDIGNYIIPSYEEFILKLNNDINKKLHNNGENSEIKFLMRYESNDIQLLDDVIDDILNPPVNQNLLNNVILRCNVPFKINYSIDNKSGILQLIGWENFNDVNSLVNHETNIHSLFLQEIYLMKK